jgi:SAM-dependent methyltransferase
MASAVENYRNMVEQPWGRMFYDQIFRQLVIPGEPRKRILDFGAGFCLTAGHYAKEHDVIAVEPSSEMLELRVRGAEPACCAETSAGAEASAKGAAAPAGDPFTLVAQGVEYLATLEDSSFDVVICHNVLEYVDDKEKILEELVRVLKPGGILSIIKHNLLGRAFASAVMADDPQAALDLLNDTVETSMFGKRTVYTNEYLDQCFSGRMKLTESFGIRAFYGLSSNNEIKYTDEWYQAMLALETKASTMDEFRKVAFFNHLLFTKVPA